MVLWLKDDYPLGVLLRRLELAKTSYYYHIKEFNEGDEYCEIRACIREEFEASQKTYSYRRLWMALRRRARPIVVSEKVVRKIMREEGLRVIYHKRPRRRWSSYAGELSEAPKNLVAREFCAPAPNTPWLTDTTQFSLPSFKCYLSPILDCFDGKVVAWEVSKNPDAKLANITLDEAIATLQGERPIFHSDRDAHYRWPGWIKRCNKAGITRPMSKKGCSPDNSAMEEFFGRLKK